MNLLTFGNPVFSCYALAATLLIIKMMSQGWITVFRMVKVDGGFRYPEDARKSLANPDPSPDQLLPNEYVERSRRMHANDVENIPLFLVAGLLYVCTSPGLWLAAGLFGAYVVSRLAHFLVLLTQQPHEVRAFFLDDRVSHRLLYGGRRHLACIGALKTLADLPLRASPHSATFEGQNRIRALRTGDHFAQTPDIREGMANGSIGGLRDRSGSVYRGSLAPLRVLLNG